MSAFVNGIEVLRHTADAINLRTLPAAVTAVWEQDAILYWDTSANEVKKFAPADSTAVQSLQASIIGIAEAGKKTGENRAVVAVKAVILADASNYRLGANFVVKYSSTTGKYSFQEDTAYDTDFDPDVTLTLAFAVAARESAEADNRGVISINGEDRINALS